MSSDLASQGSLFSVDFLQDSIRDMPEWGALNDVRLAEIDGGLKTFFGTFPDYLEKGACFARTSRIVDPCQH